MKTMTELKQIYDLCVKMTGGFPEYEDAKITITSTGNRGYNVSNKVVGAFLIEKHVTEEVWNEQSDDWEELPRVWYHFDGWYHDDFPEVTQEEAIECLTKGSHVNLKQMNENKITQS